MRLFAAEAMSQISSFSAHRLSSLATTLCICVILETLGLKMPLATILLSSRTAHRMPLFKALKSITSRRFGCIGADLRLNTSATHSVT
ncbi:MAG: hypothetical protein ACO2PM_00745, partial [Pyrobaculum sp.]